MSGGTKKPGRPRQAETLDGTVVVRVPMAEKSAMVRAAQREGVKLSAWARKVLGRASGAFSVAGSWDAQKIARMVRTAPADVVREVLEREMGSARPRRKVVEVCREVLGEG